MTGQVIRMGGYQRPASVHNRAASALGEKLAEATGGEVSLLLIEDVTRQLDRSAIDLFDMVEGTGLDICYFSSSYLTHRVPSLAVFDLPFSVGSREAMHGMLDSGLADEIRADVEQSTGFTVLGFWDNGFRHLTNRLRPIAEPDDCRGLSIRTTNSAVHQSIFRALGFQPDFIDIKDYPTAVHSEMVDAQENALANTVDFGIHETHHFVTLSGHFCGVSLVLGNAERVGAWSPDTRDAFDDAMNHATALQRRFAGEEEDRCLQVLEAAGVELIRDDAFDRQAFIEATSAVAEAAARSVDDRVLSYFRTSGVRLPV